jgi:hypothetical protein
MEHESIRRFVTQAASEGYLQSVVLDYGCGKQPYREIVEAHLPLGGIYQPFDQVRFPGNVSGENVGEGDPLTMSGWGSILCTQITQFVLDVEGLLGRFWHVLREGGYLVMTYVTNWPEVEPEDLHRHTKAGMERLLTGAGFSIVMHERRARFNTDCTDEWFYTGYGVVAKA